MCQLYVVYMDYCEDVVSDVNECDSMNGGCPDNSECVNQPGSRLCRCREGFTGEGVLCVGGYVHGRLCVGGYVHGRRILCRWVRAWKTYSV